MSSTLAPRDRSLIGARKALQKRTDCPGAAEPLYEFIPDIAGIEIRKNQHIRSARHRAERFHFLFRYRGDDSRIGLQFTVYGKRRRALADELDRAAYLVDARMLGARL